MPFRLRYQAHDLELAIGEFVVGRSTECQLSLDDPLVSRRHAALRVRADKVTVRDLGSRNGVLVNGAKIEGERELGFGDKITIGSQEMTYHSADDPPLARGIDENYRRATQTLGASYVASDFRQSIEAASAAVSAQGESSRVMQSFKLLGGVADKALAMNRVEEAERILQTLLLDVLTQARDGRPMDMTLAETSSRYACRLAGAMNRASWIDYVIELYTHATKPLPAAIVDELYTLVRKVKGVDLTALRSYIAALRINAGSFGPAERFLVQRVEGLERLVALK